MNEQESSEPGNGFRKVEIRGVYEAAKGAFVLLVDPLGREMPIFIGHPEAISISFALEA
jgi:hypothetical protein